MDLYDWEQVHRHIIVETFEQLDDLRGSALVGILNDYEIHYSEELRTVVEPIEGPGRRSAQPLTPRYAAALVSDLYQLDIKELISRYQAEWKSLRQSSLVLEMILAIEAHRFVGSLRRASDVE